MDPLESVVLDMPENSHTLILCYPSKKIAATMRILRSIDVFAKNHSYMIGIDPMLASHKLNIISAAKPIK